MFQGSMGLEDFHTKAEAEYPEEDTSDCILIDTLISGIASDKIRAQIIKEGKDVTLLWVMEIARLEVSIQKDIGRIQETAKVNYVQHEQVPRKSLNLESSNSIQQVIAVVETVKMLGILLNMVEKVRKFHYVQTFAGDVVKVDTRKDRIVKLWKQCAGIVPSRYTLRRFA